METARLIILGMAGALLLSTVVQAEEADSTVTSGKLLDQSRLRASGYGRGLTTDDTADQRNLVWSMQGAQDGNYNGGFRHYFQHQREVRERIADNFVLQ